MVASKASEIVYSAGKAVYYGPVERLLRIVGAKDAVERLGWRLHPSVEQDLSGITASFHVGSSIERMKVTTFDGERDVLQDVLGSLEDGDVFYDIGANIGLYSCFVGQRLPPGHLVAVEPHALTAARLRENLALNGCRNESHIYEMAWGDEPGEMGMVTTKNHLGTGEIALETDSGEGISAGHVAVAVGDELIREDDLPRPTVVKIDVEGAELQVIDGLRSVLSDDRCRLVYCEVHPEETLDHASGLSDAEIDELFDTLDEMGFEIDRTVDRKGQILVRAEK